MRYRELAVDSQRSADQARNPGIRKSYLDLAVQWRQLADQIDGGDPSPIARAWFVFPRLHS
jgi:hypothetical protein